MDIVWLLKYLPHYLNVYSHILDIIGAFDVLLFFLFKNYPITLVICYMLILFIL